MLKKLLEIFDVILYLIIIIAIIYIGFAMWLPNEYAQVSRYKSFVVVTDSMVPKIEPMSLIIVDKQPKTDYKVNDIITFKYDIDNDGQKEIITHRLASIENDNGIKYKTRPESTGNTDPWIISRKDVIGRVVRILPMIGLFVLGLQKVGLPILIIIDLIILILLWQTYLRWEYL